MQVQSIRFSAEQWTLIQEQAARSGMSAGQFAREAAMTRAIVLAVTRGTDDAPAKMWLRTLEVLEHSGGDAMEAVYRLGQQKGTGD